MSQEFAFKTTALNKPASHSFAEHDLVRVVEAFVSEDISVPKGSLGTIVFIHERDDAFEVEFDAPISTVVAVHRRQVEAV